MPMILSSLQFIEDGLNVCILGASDSGKTYLAKALGSIACVKYRVSYNRCNELLESLVALKTEDFQVQEADPQVTELSSSDPGRFSYEHDHG